MRYTTTAHLVNELVEAADEHHLTKTIARYGKVDLLCLDLCRPRNYADARPGPWAGALTAADFSISTPATGSA